MSKPNFLTNIWEPFGLHRDPFFQVELKLGGGEYPVRELFVGHADELRRIGRRIGGADSSRTIVEGPAGVGKTSFVNRLKLELANAGYAVHDSPIRLTDHTTPDRLLADVLRVLVRNYTAGGRPRDGFWNHAADLVESRVLHSGGVSVMGSGIQVSRQRTRADAGHAPLIEVIEEGLARFARTYEARHVLHVDNLENLRLTQVNHARSLIRNVRDVFLIPDAHWLLVGASGVEEEIFRHADQVSSIFPPAETLGPLNADDVMELLERRYQHLHVKRRNLTRPVAPADVAELYRRYRGDLRNFLSLLSDAANLLLGVEGVVPLSAEQILAAAGAQYWAKIRQRLTATDLRHLEGIATQAEKSEGFRVTDVAQWRDFSQAAASKLIGRFEHTGLIRQDRQEGRSVYYHLSGVTSVALEAGAKGGRNELVRNHNRKRLS